MQFLTVLTRPFKVLKHALFVLMILILAGCHKSTENGNGHLLIREAQLYYTAMGSGDPIIVLHGGPGFGHTYLLPWLEPLAKTHRLIFFDQRASGKSLPDIDPKTVTLNDMIDDIDAIRESFGAKKVHVLGHSWGALLAMQYALRYPEHCQSLLLLNSSAASTEMMRETSNAVNGRFTEQDGLDQQKIMQSEAFSRREPAAIESYFKTVFKASVFDRAMADKLNFGFDFNYGKNAELLQNLATEMSNFDLYPEMHKIKTPTLVVFGDHDPTPPQAGSPIHTNIAGSELIIIQDCGHFPFLERPEKFLEVTTTFLDKYPIGGR